MAECRSELRDLQVQACFLGGGGLIDVHTVKLSMLSVICSLDVWMFWIWLITDSFLQIRPFGCSETFRGAAEI